MVKIAQNTQLLKTLSRALVIYSCIILVAVMSECSVKRVTCKTWTGILANSADPDQTLQNRPGSALLA